MRRASAVALILVAVCAPRAWAHWCDDLWGTYYNLVVKPATDSVVVPTSGSATLDVFVQNNMGYPLKNFALRAASTGYTIVISRQAPKVTGFLMPGENLRHTLTITRSGGGTLAASAVSFYVDFGDGSQDQLYGNGTSGARHVVQRSTTGTLTPATPLSVPSANPQALHLASSARADFGNLNTGLDELMTEFCAGRGSWDTNGGAPVTSYCSGTATTCPAAVTRGHTKYDYQHLWASFELAYRKASLGTRAATLRSRLICATNDSSPAFKWFPYAMLGYLGEDAAVRTFFTNLIATGTADEKAAAKAGLLMFGSAADRTAYHADVVTALASSNAYVSALAATSLGIVDADDAAVAARLIPRAGWVEPDTSDNGLNFYAAHLLNLVAWNRRGWATDASYSGAVSFYSTATDTTPPQAPASATCTANANGTVRLTWPAVTLDTSGSPETVSSYRVYYGSSARPAGAQRPGDLGFSYDHLDPSTALLFDVSSLPGTGPTYFAVTAVDASGNASVYSAETSCTPRYPPTAVISCTPTSGVAPLSVTCDSSGSTDPNGASDIATRAWRLDGAAQPNGPTFATTFSGPGSHTVQLIVTDSGGLASTPVTATITVNGAGNNAPAAAATATPTTGPVPLAVTFSSAGSADPDTGQTLSFSWDFADGSAPDTAANPSHTFTAVGTYDVVLTVTDDGTPAASATAVRRVTVVPANRAPDATPASAVPQSGNAPLSVSFSAGGVADPDGDPLTFAWDFGDGATSTEQTPAQPHVYGAVGTYTARVTATDNGSPPLSDSKSFTITVRPAGTVNRPPDCSAATVTPTEGTLPLTVTLDATGCNDPDGDALLLTWRVPRTITTEDVYSVARTEVVITAPGETIITLHVRDSNAAPQEVDLTFPVNAVEGRLEPVTGSCATAGIGADLAGALGLLALVGARRRRR